MPKYPHPWASLLKALPSACVKTGTVSWHEPVWHKWDLTVDLRNGDHGDFPGYLRSFSVTIDERVLFLQFLSTKKTSFWGRRSPRTPIVGASPPSLTSWGLGVFIDVYLNGKHGLGFEQNMKLTENYIFFLSFIHSTMSPSAWLVNSANLIPNISSFGLRFETPSQTDEIPFFSVLLSKCLHSCHQGSTDDFCKG